ncbi:MAG: TadE/TadG family type IV pilus assembly protein [Kiloniellaceae bacterium]
MDSRRWARDQRGTTSVEFAAVVLVFLIGVLGVVDFARAAWTWNLAVQATQAGVRAAAVIAPAARNVRALDGLRFVPAGAPVPVAALTPNPTVCTAEGCGAALGALDPGLLDPAAFARVVARMRGFDPDIAPANVVVEYRHVGLGLAGNPVGPDIDPVITVRLRDRRFDFLGLAFLGLPALAMPDFRASLTAEDGQG